ncbi:MAG: SxtJ family membrane protein [Candidatus Omnitrophota bacterium]
MREECKEIKSGKKELRRFGLAAGTAWSILGIMFYLRHKEYYPVFFIFSFLFISLALIMPVFLNPVQKIGMTAGKYIGMVFTGIILAAVFYLVITPVGIVMRMLGKELLEVKLNPQADSYWIVRKPFPFDKKNYEH